MAFNQSDGNVAWSRNDFANTYSSSVLIDVSGLEQLAVLVDGALIAVNPHNGDLQWQVPFRADFSIAVATPLWGPDNLLFISSEYGGGSKVIELQRNGGKGSQAILSAVDARAAPFAGSSAPSKRPPSSGPTASW